MKHVFIIDSDRMFGECIARTLNKGGEEGGGGGEIQTILFWNALDAMREAEQTIPDLIISEVNLPGTNVFSLLNETISYPDTAEIPVILITNTKFPKEVRLKDYNIKVILEKEKILPEEVREYVERYTS